MEIELKNRAATVPLFVIIWGFFTPPGPSTILTPFYPIAYHPPNNQQLTLNSPNPSNLLFLFPFD